MKTNFRKGKLCAFMAVLLVAAMIAGLAVPAFADNGGADTSVRSERTERDKNQQNRKPSASGEREYLDPNEIVRVSVVLDEDSAFDAGYTADEAAAGEADEYRAELYENQKEVIALIEDKVLGGGELDVIWNLTLAANLISANVRRGDIARIEQLPGVSEVVEERLYTPDVVTTDGEYDPNMAASGEMNHTGAAWLAGYTGVGTRIAIIDTGIDAEHISFDPGAFDASVAEWEEKTGKTAELLTAADIAEALENLNIYKNGLVTADDIGKINPNSKIPYAFNYVDGDFDISHYNDNNHGSHVAGIAAANRLVDEDGDGEYEDAYGTVHVVGNAPDAQLLIMKVFGRSGGAFDSDCVAAIEDALLLGADTVNLSLGGAYSGLATPDEFYSSVMEKLETRDTVVVISAGNSGAWASNTGVNGGDLYADGVNFQTDGEPGSFRGAFTVASVESNSLVQSKFYINGEEYAYAEETVFGNAHLSTLDTTGGIGTEYKFYILPEGSGGSEKKFLDEIGAQNIKGSVVFVWRGDSSFADKANLAASMGAAAVVIINNETNTDQQLFLPNLAGLRSNIPVVMMDLITGRRLTENLGMDKTSFSKGFITIKKSAAEADDAYVMSDFSSWGVPGDLSIKPEITAPGGNIYSVDGASEDHAGYVSMSGTSMAAPQITSMTALLLQYLRDRGYAPEGMTQRQLAQSIMMSTARPMKDSAGRYYPIMQQGAGLADIGAAVSTPVFITVDGRTDGMAKVELGDDIERTGEYTFTFTFNNLTDVTRYYGLSAELFTQAVAGGSLKTYTTSLDDVTVTFTVNGVALTPAGDELKYDFNGDGVLNRRDAQLLLDSVIKGAKIEHNADNKDVDGDGDVDTHDVHVLLTLSNSCAEVPANSSTEVTVKVTLSESTKSWLERNYENGAYLESYVTAEPFPSDDGEVPPELSFPVLGFFGNWTDPSMYDIGDYILGDEEERDPYLVEQNGFDYNYMEYSLADYGYVDPYFGNIVWMDSWYFPERNSISDNMRLEAFTVAITRTAGNGVVQVRNADTGEVYYRYEVGAQYSAFCAGYTTEGEPVWSQTLTRIPIDWSPADYDGTLEDGTVLDISLILAPEYYADEDGSYDWDALTDGETENGELGHGAYFTMTMTVDNTAPVIEEDITVVEDDGLSSIVLGGAVSDNRYVAGVVVFPGDDPDEYSVASNPEYLGLYGYFDDYEEGMTLDLYGTYVPEVDPYWDGDLTDVYYIEIWDYAGNVTTTRVYYNCEPTEEVEYVEIYTPVISYYGTFHDPVTDIVLVEGASTTVKGAAMPITLSDRSVIWTSSDESVATVENGTITGVAVGEATIRATSKLDGNVYEECTVTVERVEVTASGILMDNEGITRFYEWDVANRNITVGKALDDDVVAATRKVGSDNFYMMTATGYLYEYSPEGAIAGGPWNWSVDGSGATWDITDTSLGIFSAYGPYLIGPNKNDNFRFRGYELGGDNGPYFIGVTSSEEEWNASLPNGTPISGDVLLYALDTDGTVWVIFPFYMESEGEEKLMLGTSEYSSDLPAIWGMDSLTGNPYTSLVMGDDGNLYASIYTGVNSALFQLRFDEDYEMFRGMPLDQTDPDVWPAVLLDVKPNDAASGASLAALPEKAAKTELTVFAPESVKEFEPAEKSASTIGAGRFNSVASAGVTEAGDEYGITVDAESGTVTVPVYAADTTNGEFTLRYDTDKLTLTETIIGGMLTSVVSDTEAGEIVVGYADRDDIDAVVLTAVFTYKPEVNRDGETDIVIDVAEDGAKNAAAGDTDAALGEMTTDVTLTGVTVEHTLTVKYVDENGKEIREPTETVLLEGAEYKVDAPEIDGYEYKSADGALTGTLSADTTVTLTYRTLAVYTLTVKYVDEDGKSIKDPTEEKVREDKDYKVTPPAIDGYEYKSADDELTGKLSANKTVTLTYKKTAAVTPGEGGNPTPPQTGDMMTGRASLLAAAILSAIAIAALGFTDTKKRH